MFAFFLLFVIAFSATYFSLPYAIKKLVKEGNVVKDMYKHNKPKIPTNAGIIVAFISFICIAFLPLITRIINTFTSSGEINSDLSTVNLAFLLVISTYALYGLVDDLLDISRKLKLIMPIAFGYPLISVIYPEEFWIPFFGYYDLTQIVFSDVTRSDLFRIIIIPTYVMVVSNLVNMHSGYNGLQSGLSIIIISTLIIKSSLESQLENILPAGAFLGAIVALWFYNKFPSKVFEGNIGSLLFGSVIGCIIVVQEYWWFGFFILMPHTFNFILWLIWLRLMKTNPELYLEEDGIHKKFGYLNSEGFISVPNRLTLKWIPNYYFNLDEQSSVLIMYFVTLIFCSLGLLIF